MPEPPLWFISLTVGGAALPMPAVLAALERLAAEEPFLLAGHYAGDRAEIRYWEEAELLEDACALALRVWGEHRRSARLPDWSVLGLEVVDQEMARCRTAVDGREPTLALAGGWRPFPRHAPRLR